MLFEAGVLAIRKGCIGNTGQKGYSSRVVTKAYEKLWKLEGWPTSARYRYLLNRFYTWVKPAKIEWVQRRGLIR
jgi:hypothetical protein